MAICAISPFIGLMRILLVTLGSYKTANRNKCFEIKASDWFLDGAKTNSRKLVWASTYISCSLHLRVDTLSSIIKCRKKENTAL